MVTSEIGVGDLAAEHPLATRVFERYGIDYCCGGGTALQTGLRAAGSGHSGGARGDPKGARHRQGTGGTLGRGAARRSDYAHPGGLPRAATRGAAAPAEDGREGPRGSSGEGPRAAHGARRRVPGAPSGARGAHGQGGADPLPDDSARPGIDGRRPDHGHGPGARGRGGGAQATARADETTTPCRSRRATRGAPCGTVSPRSRSRCTDTSTSRTTSCSRARSAPS